jgi:hypothetical protein
MVSISGLKAKFLIRIEVEPVAGAGIVAAGVAAGL